MEKELEKQVKFVEEKLSSIEFGYDLPQLKDNDVKEILHDVLNELYYKKDKR
ncbi:MAG: hypothetical protein ACJ71G_13180 [Nitrososphaeraceae archaeon]